MKKRETEEEEKEKKRGKGRSKKQEPDYTSWSSVTKSRICSLCFKKQDVTYSDKNITSGGETVYSKSVETLIE
jgi:hypothetical protein